MNPLEVSQGELAKRATVIRTKRTIPVVLGRIQIFKYSGYNARYGAVPSGTCKQRNPLTSSIDVSVRPAGPSRTLVS